MVKARKKLTALLLACMMLFMTACVVVVRPDPDDATADNAAIALAKAAVESASYAAGQSAVNDAAQAKTIVENKISNIVSGGVTAVVNGGTFTAAVAQTASKDGANGSYTFTVTLTKGKGAAVTTATLSLIINYTVNNPVTLQIAVRKLGNGSKFAYELAKAYEKKRNGEIKVQVVYDSSSDDFLENSLGLGPDGNDIDVYFAARYMFFDLVARGGGIAKGYNPVFADLTDIWESDASGYGYKECVAGTKVKDLFYDVVREANAYPSPGPSKGKQFFVPWATLHSGLVYNKKLWDVTNSTVAASDPLKLPRTTDEMFTLFDRIKKMRDTDKTISANPFKYSGTVDYLATGSRTWYAQYDGIENARLFKEGRDHDGVYTPDIFAYGDGNNARAKAFEVVRKMVDRTNKYTAGAADHAADFTNAQLEFLAGDAFFNFNGSWLECETEAYFPDGTAEPSFFKMPVISAIKDNLPDSSVGSDAELSALIGAIDTGASALSGTFEGVAYSVTQADFNKVKEARGVVLSGNHGHQMLIPAYSDRIDDGKDFIKFCISKEGQEIMLACTKNDTFPLNVDRTQLSTYAASSVFAKSNWQLFNNDTVVYDTSWNTPMMYLGVMSFDPGSFAEISFGGTSAKTVKQHMDSQYNEMYPKWVHMMTTAGVSNG